MAARFTLKQASDGQHYFNLVAENGEIILTGERYTTSSSARDGIESVRQNGPLASRYERRQAKDGQEYFVLKAANGEVIGTSEMYTTAGARQQGVEAVMRAVASALGPGPSKGRD